jgi:cell division ATPase FtsA
MSIVGKFERRQYEDLSSWVSDVSQVFENAIILDGGRKYMTSVAKFLKRRFEKQYQISIFPSLSHYFQQLVQLFTEFNTVVTSKPLSIRGELRSAAAISEHFEAASLTLLCKKLNKISTTQNREMENEAIDAGIQQKMEEFQSISGLQITMAPHFEIVDEKLRPIFLKITKVFKKCYKSPGHIYHSIQMLGILEKDILSMQQKVGSYHPDLVRDILAKIQTEMNNVF